MISKSLTVLTLLSLVALFPNSVDAVEPIVISLHRYAAPSHEVITLGDLATISCENPKLSQSLALIDIADWPLSGEPLRISRKQILVRLQLLGLRADEIRLVGAEDVRVVAQKKLVDPEQVILFARQELQKLLGVSQSSTIELLQPILVPLPEISPRDTVRFEARPQTAVTVYGRNQMNTTIFVNNEKKLILPLTFFVAPSAVEVSSATTGSSLRLTSGYERGPTDRQTLLPPNITSETFRRPPGTGQEPISPGPSGMMLPPKQNLPLSTTNHLMSPPAATRREPVSAIKPYQKVLMVVRWPGGQVSTMGEALQGGKVGEYIKLRNLDSKKEIYGQVVDAHTVVVPAGGGS